MAANRNYSQRVSRRRFLQTTAAAGAGVSLWGVKAHAESPNGRLQMASVGVGGMGGADLGQFLGHPKVDVVALVDVDSRILEAAS